MFAGVSALIAQLETIVGIPYNIDADLIAPSMMAYRDPRRSGAWWVISDEHTRVISGEQRRAWRSEFERQVSGEVHERLYRAARARLRMYAGRTKHVNDADVDDVVMAALADTFDGTLSWNPEKPLERHLLDAIAFRVPDQARYKRRHVEEAFEEDGEAIAPCMLGDAGEVLVDGRLSS